FDATTGQQRFYLDGALVASGVKATTISYDTHPLVIGNDINSGGNDLNGPGTRGPIKGLIDEPALYNRALTATETPQLYHADTAGKCISAPPTPTPSPTISSTPTVQPGAPKVWDLAGDYRRSPNQENPSRDQYGKNGVWNYLYGAVTNPDHATASF